TYGYDGRDRRNQITLKNSAATTLRTESYVYNDASEISSHTVSGAATNYAYDLAGQLTSESRTGYSASYTYDANGNRLKRTVGSVVEDFAYDVGDKLQTIKIGGVTQRSYSYNAAGSVTAVTTANGTTSITWDADERVKTMTAPNLVGQSTFAYNGEGARVSATENGVTRNDLRDGTSVTAPVLEDSLASYTPGISERRASISTFNHAGIKNVAAQTDASGAVSGTRQYDAFGQILATSNFKGPFGYGANYGYREDQSGLKVLGHRLYDASAGRFLSRDTAQAGRNWYTYCDNDPVNFADPRGQDLLSTLKRVGEAIKDLWPIVRDIVTGGSKNPPKETPKDDPKGPIKAEPGTAVIVTKGGERHVGKVGGSILIVPDPNNPIVSGIEAPGVKIGPGEQGPFGSIRYPIIKADPPKKINK
ncbi:hypothetical protein EON81_20790, partial [bacterium]